MKSNFNGTVKIGYNVSKNSACQLNSVDYHSAFQISPSTSFLFAWKLKHFVGGSFHRQRLFYTSNLVASNAIQNMVEMSIMTRNQNPTHSDIAESMRSECKFA